MKRDARTAILEAGAELVHRKGFNNTGIKEILDVAGVPKGSFYFYFPSKEEFGLALIEHFRSVHLPAHAGILSDRSIPPLKRLRLFLQRGRERYEQWEYERGCPFGNLAQEMCDLSPAMCDKLRDVFGGLSRAMGDLLSEAASRGELARDIDPQDAAAFIFDALEGAILRMKAEKNLEPLLRLERMLFALFVAEPAATAETAQPSASEESAPPHPATIS